MGKPGSILFISHDASKSGAPILLLNLLRLIKQEGACDFKIIIRKGGPLNKEFETLGPTIVLKPANYLSSGNFIGKMAERLRNRYRMVKAMLLCRRSDLVFSNTITNGSLLDRLATFHKPVISYVHELASVVGVYEEEAGLTVKNTDLFLYPSLAVRNFLADHFNVQEDRMEPLPYYFPALPLGTTFPSKRECKKAFAARYGLDPETMWVVGMGTASMRKGVDLFINTCEKLRSEKISFIWIGGYENEEVKNYVNKRLAATGNQGIVFTGEIPYQQDNLLPFDVFFLSSREDPYPLVVLEAAYLGIPSVCFRSGGMVEFIGEDCGWIIDNFSVDKAAVILTGIIQDTEIRSRMGQNAKEKVEQRHFSPALMLKAMRRAVEKAMANKKIHHS
jgi:glycosyltransferase involved in cell wall biosynthesis